MNAGVEDGDAGREERETGLEGGNAAGEGRCHFALWFVLVVGMMAEMRVCDVARVFGITEISMYHAIHNLRGVLLLKVREMKNL